MGIAAYNRGSNVLRKQLDREHPANNSTTPIAWTDERARLNARIAELENDLIRAKRCIKVQSLQLTIERRQSTELQSSFRVERMEWFRALVKARKNITGLSAMIRACLTPRQVQEYRDGR